MKVSSRKFLCTAQTEYSYEPFGKTTFNGAPSSNPSQYTGRENDAATGLYYYRARYYSPTLQRFISEDPINFAGGDTNLYPDALPEKSFATAPPPDVRRGLCPADNKVKGDRAVPVVWPLAHTHWGQARTRGTALTFEFT